MGTSDEAPVSLAPPGLHVCGFWRRVGAFLLDGLILGVAGQVSGLFLLDFYAGLGGWARLIGFGVSLAYFGVLNSAWGGGRSIGKRLVGIEVVDARGNHISLGRSVLRALVLATPFFLNGLPISTTGPGLAFQYLSGFLTTGIGLSAVYLYSFNRRTRQSIHDLAAGSFVVRGDRPGIFEPKPIWRPHLAIVGAWCLAVIGASFLLPQLMRIGALADIVAVQQKLQASEKVSSASFVVGRSFHTGATGGTSFVQSNVTLWKAPGDYQAVAAEMASIILANYPAIAKQDALVVTVCYGYDIGIASSWIRMNFRYLPPDWGGLLKASRKGV